MAGPFSEGLMQRALLEVLLLGVLCGPLGTWVLIYRQSYAAEALAHGLLPGLVVAAVAGVPVALGAAGGALVAAGAISASGRDARIGPDVGVGVAITALFGAGVLMALTPTAPAQLEELLFGDLLGVGVADLVVAGVLSAVVLAALVAGHRALTLAAFDPGVARALGARPGRVELGLLALLALTVVAAVQALGNLLVVAMLIAPAAAARRLADRLVTVLVLSAAIAATAGVAGLLVSYYLELAVGASIALCALSTFGLAALVTRPPGLSPE